MLNMGKSIFLLCLLIVVLEGAVSDEEPKKKSTGRQPRNFDGFADFSNYFKEDESREQPEKPVYSDAGSGPSNPPQRSKPYGNLKAYKDNFNYPGKFPLVFKGYPYYKETAQPSANPEQPMVDMMSMMTMMKQLQDGDSGKEPGFLQKLVSDPRTILIAALIPVSIMLASFIPLIVNYFMAGSSLPSIITSVASGSAGRSLKESDFLRTLLRGIDHYGRSLESHKCLEEAVCQFVTDTSKDGGLENVKLAARSFSKFLKTEWVGDGRFADLLSGIRRKECSNVCEKFRARKKKGDGSK